MESWRGNITQQGCRTRGRASPLACTPVGEGLKASTPKPCAVLQPQRFEKSKTSLRKTVNNKNHRFSLYSWSNLRRDLFFGGEF